jgi:nucleotide-binding universal stress UspA family protein
LLFGSVAEAVLQKATCPVLTAKVPQAMTAEEGRPEGTAPWPLKTILHPTDFSEDSEAAFRLARGLARDHHARLVLLHVTVLPDLAYRGYGAPGTTLQEGEYLADVREELEKLDPGPDVTTERRLREGETSDEILRAAADSGADLIVMGTHGRSGLRHLLLGSVADKVVRQAHCPVLTVRPSDVGALAPAADERSAGGRQPAKANG